jgi:cytosine/adenosine deaminase-related metal-dependent hydrolase
VDANGRIAAVGSNSHVPAPAGVQALHFPDAELMPGLVNCHTHLDLTHLGGGAKHDEPEFLKWIRRIRELKETTSAAAFYEAAVAGIRDCWARGVTCIAETGSTGAVMRALHDLGGRGIVYQEVFGPDPAQCDASMRELKVAVDQLRRLATSQLRPGVSPHAPYTVSAPLYEAVAQFARLEQLPIAVHVAESKEETVFVRAGAGPFAEALRARGIIVQPQHCSPVAYLVQRAVVQRGTLCIHCVQVDDSDVTLLRKVGASVAHCPRSNAAHRHGRLPLALFRNAGVPVGLGTDSVVSVGELDPWAEAEAVGLTGDAALRMLTMEGARALGWEKEIGSLEVGKSADLAVFSSTILHQPPPSSTALLTVVSGRIVYRAGSPEAH